MLHKVTQHSIFKMFLKLTYFLNHIFFTFLGTDDEQQEFDYLGAWGPRFDKLADMYGQEGESEEEDEDDV